jgi:hypothetical protein
MCERGIYGREVLPNNRFPSFAVALADELFDLLERFFARQHAAQREETRLHNRIDAIAELRLPRHASRVDNEYFQPLIDDRLLNRTRELVPGF